MRLRPPTVRILIREVNGTVEAQPSIGQDIDVQRLEVGGGVDQPDVPGLHEVVGDDDVLLVGGDLDVVRPDGGLDGVWVVEALHVVKVGDVERGDVVCGCEGEVGEAAIGADVGAGGG
jgi:hypothetical protein